MVIREKAKHTGACGASTHPTRGGVGLPQFLLTALRQKCYTPARYSFETVVATRFPTEYAPFRFRIMNGNQDRSRKGPAVACPAVACLIPMVGDGRLSASPSRLATPVRGLLLDMCNVLYDDTVWRRWVLQLLGHLGLQTNYRCFFHVWDRDFLDDVHRGERSFCDAFEAFLRSVGLSHGQIDEMKAACLARRRHLEVSTRPLPGVRTTLTRLHRAGFVLGAIANSEYPADTLRERLARFGVGELFTTVISSIDLGATMPSATGYRAALHAMGLSAAQVAFVDHDSGELAGATAVGMPTVAFNFDPEAEADVYLGRFEDLINVVGPCPLLTAAG